MPPHNSTTSSLTPPKDSTSANPPANPEPPATASPLREQAHRLAAGGAWVFPLRPGTKTPAIPMAHRGKPGSCRGECGRLGHGLWDATRDPAVIERWWTHCPTANIGISCGASGVIVVDLDTPKANTPAPWPPFDVDDVRDGFDALAVLAEQACAVLPTNTLEVRTGRGGTHLYFRMPENVALGNTTGRPHSGLGWLIDTRGVGGCIVAPGSIVNGSPYTVIHAAAPAPLPRWLLDLLNPAPKPVQPIVPPRSGKPSRYAEAVLNAVLSDLASAAPGSRNNSLNRAAYILGRHAAAGTVPADVAEAALDSICQQWCGDLAKSQDTVRRGMAAGAHAEGGAR